MAAEQTSGADLATIVVKRTPFTAAEVRAFTRSIPGVRNHVPIYAPGAKLADTGVPGDTLVRRLAASSDAEVDQIVSDSSSKIDAITDDSPFFWHFNSFRDVLSDITTPIPALDPEDSIGERVLLLLLAVSIVYAAVFLLLPFLSVREQWRALPVKGTSALYFACLGLGFMFFEITMIQRLVRFLGYPSYSLTVTLASILVFSGIGALLSRRLVSRARVALPAVLGALALLTIFYAAGLDPATDALLSSGLPCESRSRSSCSPRSGSASACSCHSASAWSGELTDHGEEYVAWSWAVNGFFSVIGSVLTTMLSMTYGFQAVQFAALGIYCVAVLLFLRLHRAAERTEPDVRVEDSRVPALGASAPT